MVESCLKKVARDAAVVVWESTLKREEGKGNLVGGFNEV